MQSIAIDRLHLQYTDEGEGMCVLALHGMPGSHREFRWIANELGRDVRLVRVDLPGFGASTGSRLELPQSLAAIADVMRRFAERVVAGPYVVLGYSFGAPLATLVAAGEQSRTAPCRGLAWVAPVGLRPHRVMRRAQHVHVVRVMSQLSRARVIGRPLLRAWRLALRATGFPPGVSLSDVARKLDVQRTFEFSQHRDALARVAVPVFVAWAQDDPFVEDEIVRELCDCAPAGPRLQFPVGGHFLLKTRAAEVAAGLASFAQDCQQRVTATPA